jgi:hypothetical protein
MIEKWLIEEDLEWIKCDLIEVRSRKLPRVAVRFVRVPADIRTRHHRIQVYKVVAIQTCSFILCWRKISICLAFSAWNPKSERHAYTKSIVQNLCWEALSPSTNLDTSFHLRNPNISYRVHKSIPVDEPSPHALNAHVAHSLPSCSHIAGCFSTGRSICSHLLKLVPHSRIFLPWRWRRHIPPKRRFT